MRVSAFLSSKILNFRGMKLIRRHCRVSLKRVEKWKKLAYHLAMHQLMLEKVRKKNREKHKLNCTKFQMSKIFEVSSFFLPYLHTLQVLYPKKKWLDCPYSSHNFQPTAKKYEILDIRWRKTFKTYFILLLKHIFIKLFIFKKMEFLSLKG